MPILNRPRLPIVDAAHHYSAALDSANLINLYLASPPEGMSPEDVTSAIARNVEHLKIMVAKTFWTTEDLTPLHNAITAGTPAG